jgi:uncharacterized protein GlcG (DUF336 family)
MPRPTLTLADTRTFIADAQKEASKSSVPYYVAVVVPGGLPIKTAMLSARGRERWSGL